MRSPDFWWRPGSFGSRVLAPLGALYGAIAGRRLHGEAFRPGVPVICVGNFVAGGAGKTPVAISIARRLIAAGHRPVFLTRGYGGSLREPVQVDLVRHDASHTGDEPQLLAAVAPTVVARRRDAGARLAATLGDVIVMDDGLQNPSVRKTLSISVVDGGVGLGNGRCIPAGPLRAPMDAQWALAQAVVIVGPGEPGRQAAATAAHRGLPVLHAALRPAAGSERLKGSRVYAFAGIGRPEKFFDSLRTLGADVVRTRSFGDHRPYSAGIIARLLEEAAASGVTLVTTEKDMARIRPAVPHGVAAKIKVLDVAAAFEDPEAVERLILSVFSAP